MKVYEFTGKNVEKAIENGLNELGKSKFDVDIKILETGGLFKKAKVQISVEDDEKVNFEEPVVEEKPLESETLHEEDEKVTIENNEEINSVELDESNEQTQLSEENVAETLDDGNVEFASEEPLKKVKARKYENNKGSKEFLEGLLSVLKIDGSVEIVEEETHTKAIISTEKSGLIIGYRGEMISAIQYLANIIEQKQNRYAKRLIVDTSDYRDRRDDSLKDLADRMARKVVKYKQSVKLRPMNAYDRRIVHTYLQHFKGVTTHSVGKEPNRCLIIDVDRNID